MTQIDINAYLHNIFFSSFLRNLFSCTDHIMRLKTVHIMKQLVNRYVTGHFTTAIWCKLALNFLFFIIKWLPGIAKHADAKLSMKYTPPKSDLGGSKKSFIIEVFMGLWQRKHAIPPSFDQRIYLLDVIGSENSFLWKFH